MATTALYRVTVTYTVNGKNCANVFYMLSDDGTASGTKNAAALCARMVTHHGGVVAPYLSSGTHITKYSAMQVGHLLLDPDASELAADITGAHSSGPAEGSQLACCFDLRTGLAGRSRRGRFFQGGLPDEWTEQGKLTTAGQTGFSSIAGGLQTAWTGASPTSGYNMQVFSKKYFSLTSNPFESSYKPVTQITNKIILSTMRHRKPTA